MSSSLCHTGTREFTFTLDLSPIYDRRWLYNDLFFSVLLSVMLINVSPCIEILLLGSSSISAEANLWKGHESTSIHRQRKGRNCKLPLLIIVGGLDYKEKLRWNMPLNCGWVLYFTGIRSHTVICSSCGNQMQWCIERCSSKSYSIVIWSYTRLLCHLIYWGRMSRNKIVYLIHPIESKEPQNPVRTRVHEEIQWYLLPLLAYTKTNITTFYLLSVIRSYFKEGGVGGKRYTSDSIKDR